MEISWNRPGWAEIEKQVVDEVLRPLSERLAGEANDGLSEASPETGRPQHAPGYFAGTQGEESKRLEDGSYRATVIVGTDEAAADNARNNTLINLIGKAEEALRE